MKDSISIRASDASHRPRRGLHQHKHYEILIIKQGGGHHIVDFERFDVVEPKVAIDASSLPIILFSRSAQVEAVSTFKELFYQLSMKHTC